MRFIRHTNGQIRALETFTLYDGRVITAGTLGGTIDSIRNLSQAGTSWVFPGGSIEGNAHVSGNAVIQSGSVAENAKVYGNAVINGAIIRGNARVLGDAFVQKGESGFLLSRAAVNSNWNDDAWQSFVDTEIPKFWANTATVLSEIDTFLSGRRPDGIKLMSHADWLDFNEGKSIVAWSRWCIGGTVVAGEAHVSGNSKVINNGKVLGKLTDVYKAVQLPKIPVLTEINKRLNQ